MTSQSPTLLLTHSRMELALHQLRQTDGPPLLLLHGLGERSPLAVPSPADRWPGAIWHLDFTGHGGSDVPVGGGYTAEVLMGDVDTALAHLGPCTILGRGLGGYVGLLIAGARPDLVNGAIITDGPGLAGGGIEPGSVVVHRFVSTRRETPDPYALVELARDIRPPDYATSFARQALQYGPTDPAISVASVHRPPWLTAVAAEFGVWETTLDSALDHYAEAITGSD
ncbi:MAG: alpha/beta hydrolase [Actinomycetia bacterium]|nr:alpha/beta hydrolase [Actinomycetes bacterium]